MVECVFKKRKEYLHSLLAEQYLNKPKKSSTQCFAPSNIALIKYWGKDCSTLFIPANSSLSLSLGSLGAKTSISLLTETKQDSIFLNQEEQPLDSRFSMPIVEFLNLFRQKPTQYFCVQTTMNIPHSSGLASSACGFAALTLALQDLFGWKISVQQLSLIARLGSGSACRSLFSGFVLWNKGSVENPLSSYAQKVDEYWPEIRFALLRSKNTAPKKISSRQAMKDCALTSPYYQSWPSLSEKHVQQALLFIKNKNFTSLGELMEHNTELMHSVIQSSKPAVFFRTSQTLALIEKVLLLREQGLEVYYTQDAGHHLKLLFLEKDTQTLKKALGDSLEVISPFDKSTLQLAE